MDFIVRRVNVKGSEDDRPPFLGNRRVRILEFQGFGLVVKKPSPPGVGMFELHAGKLRERPAQSLDIENVIIETDRLKNFSGHCHDKPLLHAFVPCRYSEVIAESGKPKT